MTKEERAEKWFSSIPNADTISMEAKIDICSKVARKMAAIFLVLLAVECVLLFMVSGGEAFNFVADFFNRALEGNTTKNHYRGLAILGGLLCLPFIAFPLLAAFAYRNKHINAEVAKIIDSVKKDDMEEPYLMNLNEKSTEDIIHFDNLNFKLAIIQVLMYDLKLLKPEFDLYDFADQHKGEEIDTESYTVIEPAMNFFKELEIPKKLATYVETIYMDGGNDVYMHIIPQWDGEDESFDLNEVTLSELQQFSNLKKATVMSCNFDKIKRIFDDAGVDVELL